LATSLPTTDASTTATTTTTTATTADVQNPYDAQTTTQQQGPSKDNQPLTMTIHELTNIDNDGSHDSTHVTIHVTVPTTKDLHKEKGEQSVLLVPIVNGNNDL
jgi:hypothetical protein